MQTADDGENDHVARRISSRWTYFYKRVFPTIWFGLLLLFWLFGLSRIFLRANPQREDFAMAVAPILVAIFFFLIMNFFVWIYVDEVWDCGDYLVVRNRGEEHELPLQNIQNVYWSVMQNPPHVLLMLREPTPFGRKIVFIPPAVFNPLRIFSPPPIALELIERCDQARDAAAVSRQEN